MRTVSIVGVGLIGASFGLAIRKAGFSGKIFGVSSPASIKAGIETGAIDAGLPLEEAAAASDLLYLAQPISQIIQTLGKLGPLVHPGCLVTDAGSTKTEITAAAREHLPGNSFLGGHPMAGKEQRGARAADPNLFAGRPYVLTGSLDIASPIAHEFRKYLYSIGARIFEMTPQEHDLTVAFTSHLPQLLSTALAATLNGEPSSYMNTVFGPGLLDMTRLSLSPSDVWTSVLATNKESIDKALHAFEATLHRLRSQLEGGSVAELFDRGRSFALSIRSAPEISTPSDMKLR